MSAPDPARKARWAARIVKVDRAAPWVQIVLLSVPLLIVAACCGFAVYYLLP
jgi:hypothetical protein